jgi:DegV family protein with EDD domain
MSVRIVTDSTCDLPAETVARCGIHVVPLYIHVGKHGYLDGIDMGREEFYTKLPTFSEHPTTAVPSIERFRAAYHTLADEGATEILSIHVASTLSAVVDVARLAARDNTPVPVTVLDSQQISLALGFLVEKAASMAAAGRPSAEILDALTTQIQRSHIFAAIDTLEFLRRSGRMNKYMAGIASLLQVKPIITLYKGIPITEKVRTQEHAVRRLVELVAAVKPLERVAMLHTHALPERLADLRSRVASLLPRGDLLTADVTPAIGVHLGPDALGFAVVSAIK